MDGDGGAARAARALLGDAEIDLSAVGEADDAWAEAATAGRDDAGLPAEENRLRYVPVPSVTVRVAPGAARWDVLRVLNGAVGALGVADVRVSVAPEGGGGGGGGGAVHAAGGAPAGFLPWVVESDAAFADRVRAGEMERVRWIGPVGGGGAGRELWEASIAAGVTVLDAPVVAAPAVELLTLMREQAISRTRHRFGHLTE
ncbi:hypothetical protein [Litorihabitans aurantiacus]|uniref:hypothetical protein n=1 Tax=Litorihabitans aurantiacus TaxID=1930061 RepID=UPI0024E18362|nr:hypothetical protein [Litorihabitans aurantiacus]